MKYAKSSNDIHLFMDTHIGDFAVSIFYDATGLSILVPLLNFYKNFIICVTYNREVGLFGHLFRALNI